jgi:hypothetical protein
VARHVVQHAWVDVPVPYVWGTGLYRDFAILHYKDGWTPRNNVWSLSILYVGSHLVAINLLMPVSTSIPTLPQASWAAITNITTMTHSDGGSYDYSQGHPPRAYIWSKAIHDSFWCCCNPVGPLYFTFTRGSVMVMWKEMALNLC